MLRLPQFVYEQPGTMADAVALLSRYGEDAMVIAGGTDLLPNMKQRLSEPKVLVDLHAIPEMNAISYDNQSGLEIGALTALRAIAAHALVVEQYGALATAASLVSTPELRRMGTIGGNLCLDTRCYYFNQQIEWREALGYCLKKGGDVCRVAPGSERCLAVNSSDLAPVLTAFDATLHVDGPTGRRRLRIADMYGDDGRRPHELHRGEILTKISLPSPPQQTRSAYRKLRLRESFDFPIASVAAVVQLNAEGICGDARIVAGALGPRPLECAEAASALIGTRLDEASLRTAADCVYRTGKPMENTATSPAYRKRMLRVLAYRTLSDLTLPSPPGSAIMGASGCSERSYTRESQWPAGAH